jgi:hypothetical protein
VACAARAPDAVADALVAGAFAGADCGADTPALLGTLWRTRLLAAVAIACEWRGAEAARCAARLGCGLARRVLVDVLATPVPSAGDTDVAPLVAAAGAALQSAIRAAGAAAHLISKVTRAELTRMPRLAVATHAQLPLGQALFVAARATAAHDDELLGGVEMLLQPASFDYRAPATASEHDRLRGASCAVSLARALAERARRAAADVCF